MSTMLATMSTNLLADYVYVGGGLLATVVIVIVVVMLLRRR